MQSQKLLGKNLNRLRMQSGITQEELCEAAEIDRSYLPAYRKRLYKSYACSFSEIEACFKGVVDRPSEGNRIIQETKGTTNFFSLSGSPLSCAECFAKLKLSCLPLELLLCSRLLLLFCLFAIAYWLSRMGLREVGGVIGSCACPEDRLGFWHECYHSSSWSRDVAS